jgi:hypothetical protein
MYEMPVSISRVLPPEKWKERQIKNLSDVGQANFEVGIDNPKKDPIKAGIDAEPKYAARTKAAIEAKRRAKHLAQVTPDEWNSLAHAFADKLVEGVKKREAKVAGFIDAWVPKLQSHLSKIDAIPVTTDADAEKKMVENLRGLKALHGATKGG